MLYSRGVILVTFGMKSTGKVHCLTLLTGEVYIIIAIFDESVCDNHL